MSQPDSEWKQKYLTNLDRLEKMEKRWHEVENLLRLGITRVSLAAQGVDAKLDKELDYLRKSIRTGEDYPGLDSIVEDIATSVKRIDQIRNGETTPANTPQSVFENLLDNIVFPKQVKKRVKQLQKKIKRGNDEQTLDEALRTLASIISDSISPEVVQSNRKSGNIFDRLFNTNDAQQVKSNSQAGELLPKHLLHQITDEIVNDLLPQHSLQTIHACLDNAVSEDQILYCLSQLNVALLPLTHAQQASPAPQTDKTTETEVQVVNGDHLVALMRKLNLHDSHSSQFESIKTRLNSIKNSIDLKNITNDIATLVHTVFTVPAATTTTPTPISPATQEQTGLRDFCMQLIDTLNFPVDLQSQANSLREKIIPGVAYRDTPIILNGIADLVTLTRVRIETEKKDLESFLQQLTRNLSDIDEHIAGAETFRAASFHNSRAFGDAMEAQVNDLQNSMLDASELPQLKQAIQFRLDAIRTHIVEYRENDSTRQLHLEQELAKTNVQLKALEKEAQQLRERLNTEHEQAILDALTGVHNRLAYEERIVQEFARFKRYRKPLALLIFDIDYFKKINDTYGHKAGDKALRIIAKCLEANLRESDFLARYGGEEFVVLMPETDINAAVNAANKLRIAVEQNPFHYQEKDVPITVSCGIAQFLDSDSPESAFQRADQALYFCKQNGRNRCYAK